MASIQSEGIIGSRGMDENFERPDSPISSPATAAANCLPLSYDRLVADIPSLPKALAAIATTVVDGADSMDPSNIDMLGRRNGIRWWKVQASGSWALYYECVQMCALNPAYLEAAPEDVKKMIDAFLSAEDNDDDLHQAAKQISLRHAMAEDQAERDSTNVDAAPRHNSSHDSARASKAVAEMATVWEHRRIPVPSDISRLYRSFAYKEEDAGDLAPRKRKRDDREELSDQSSRSGTQMPPRRASYVKRRKRHVVPDEISSEDEIFQPPVKRKAPKKIKKDKKIKKKGELAPGKKYYQWPAARLRIFRDVKGVDDEDLPKSALGGPRHELESVCTSSVVDLRLCNFDLSVEEILTYFPRHTVWRESLWRIMQHWSAMDIVEFIYWTRDLVGEKTVMRATIQKEFGEVKKWAEKKLEEHRAANEDVESTKASFARSKVVGPKTMSNMASVCRDSGNTGCDKCDPFNYYVHDLADGVHDGRHPTGKGAQLLTRVIEHVRAVGDHDLLLSGVVHYAHQHGLYVPVADQLTREVDIEDKDARNRHKRTIADAYQARFHHHPR